METAKSVREDTPAAEERVLPVLDLGPFLAGDRDAEAALAAELRHACENIGFFFVENHGVPREAIDGIFGEIERFHALPAEEKLALKVSEDQRGYIPPKATVIRHSKYHDNRKLDSNETFVFATDYGPDHPGAKANQRFYGPNQWPARLPGFREKASAFANTVTALGRRTLPLWALALELPRDFFAPHFENNYTYCRMAHYPPEPDAGPEDFGIGAHADTGFMTFLPQADVEGLEILDTEGNWFRPPRMDDAMLVNTGQFLERWSNDRFRATPHRVIPPRDRHRYSVAVFVNSSLEAEGECLPTCRRPGEEPRYPTQTYREFFEWYMTNAYPHYGKVSGEE